MSPTPDNVHPLQRRQRFGPNGAWLFDRLADALAARALPIDRHDGLRERVLARIAGAGSSHTVRSAEGAWLPLAPGVTIKVLRHDTADHAMTAYIRLQPGASLDRHSHGQAEECLLLEGEIRIGTHRLTAGDLHVAAAGTEHGPVHSPAGALLLVRGAYCLPR